MPKVALPAHEFPAPAQDASGCATLKHSGLSLTIYTPEKNYQSHGRPPEKSFAIECEYEKLDMEKKSSNKPVDTMTLGQDVGISEHNPADKPKKKQMGKTPKLEMESKSSQNPVDTKTLGQEVSNSEHNPADKSKKTEWHSTEKE